MSPVIKGCGAITLLLGAFACGIGYRCHQEAADRLQPTQAEASIRTESASLHTENDALRKEVASLEQQLQDSKKASASGSASSGARGDVSHDAVAIPSPAQVEDLAAKARTALQAKDVDALSKAVLALLDMGEPAYGALIPLIREMHDRNNLGWLIDAAHQDAWQKMRLGFLRSPKLPGLLDAILMRGGASDKATLIAMEYYSQGVQSQLSKERQTALLLGIIQEQSAIPPDLRAFNFHEKGDLIGFAIGLLSTLKSKEAFPELERLFFDATTNDDRRDRLLDCVTSMGGSESVASLRRMLDKTNDVNLRQQIISSSLGSPAQEINALWWELADKETDARTHAWLMQTLGSRPENLDRLIQRFNSLQPDDPARQAILGGLLGGAMRGGKEHQQAVWSLYESDPSCREGVLDSMLMHSDLKATEILFQRLQEGQATEKLLSHLAFLDAKVLRDHAEVLRSLVGNTATPSALRDHAFWGLYNVDRQGALNALMTGFPQRSEEDRWSVIQVLIGTLSRGPETKTVLEGIASSDPSEKVREAASQALKR